MDQSQRAKTRVTLQVLACGVIVWLGSSNLVQAQFAVPMVTVPAAHHQPLGPGYTYRIGRYEVTNQQFSDFLNDARAQPGDPRGAFLSFDPLSGIVALSGDATLLFDPAIAGGISFDPQANQGNGAYAATTGYGGFPVSGVSWYGAVKYGNWLTVAQGMTQPDQRVYHEGPTAVDWYPLVIPPAAATTRDLNTSERAALASLYRGFRLPMDESTLAASAYNEWYKAAAWLDGPRVHAAFGFGRDVLSGAGANYKSSGDPFEEGPTPTGFYGINGDRLQSDPLYGWPISPPAKFGVLDTANGYGIYDLTGNIAEWVQDFGDAVGERATRGGHFGNVADSVFLRNASRLSRPATTALREVGFRVAQVIVPPLAAEVPVAQNVIRSDGWVGGPLSVTMLNLTVQNLTTQTIDDVALTPSQAGLVVPQSTGNQIGPTGVTTYAITIDPYQAGETETPPAPELVLVSGDDFQTGGPAHDFWIARTEVSNEQFAEFLNDALANAQSVARNERSAHMYFDVDSGRVYVNDQSSGTVGAGAPSATLVTLLYDATVGKISHAGNHYTVTDGFAAHPVVGVTWFGAVKYCNWRSLDEGLPPSLRAYSEAPYPALDQWRPVSAATGTWQPGTFDAAARSLWIHDTLGYRLPMDEEMSGVSAFNEWHKAAAYRGLDAAGFPQFDAAYATGRDAIEYGDANTLHNGDGFDPGTSPVGFFDGTNRLAAVPSVCLAVQPAGEPTHATNNGYGLHDLSGNVAEWMTDFGTDALQRGVRGGSWRSSALSPLLTNAARDSRPAAVPMDDLGFRVVREAGRVAFVRVHSSTFGVDHTAHVIIHLKRPLRLWPEDDTAWTLPYAGFGSGSSTTYIIGNAASGAISVSASVNVPWLEVQALGLSSVSAQEVSGFISPLGSVYVDVSATAATAQLAPGEHVGMVTVKDETSAVTMTRMVRLTISPPVILTEEDQIPADFHGFPGGPFQTSVLSTKFPPDVAAYVLTNRSSRTLDYAFSIDQSWIKLEPADPLQGTIGPAPASVTILARMDASTAALAPGVYAAQVQASLLDSSNNDLAFTVTHPVQLTVDDWVDVAPAGDWVVSHVPQQMAPARWPIQLQNRAPGTVDVQVCVDRPWLEVEATDMELAAGQTDVVYVALSAEADDLPNGEYAGHIVVDDLVSGAEQVRAVRLSIRTDFAVTPSAPLATSAVAGGAARTPAKVYVLTNGGASALAWSATAPGGPAWLRINGQSASSGVIPAFSSVPVVVSIDAAQTALLTAGLHSATVDFSDSTSGLVFTRTINVNVVTPRFAARESLVSRSTVQPNGPAHSFVLGSFPITNAEFTAFLNDALANPTHERGQLMYFDTATGDVYVNFALIGETGAGAGGRTVKMFAPAVGGQISWYGTAYQVVTTPFDAAAHPVTGVSWYGAVKFANWLSIDQGFTPEERCYAENSAALLSGWRPVTTSDSLWAVRDLNDAERQVLVTSCPGFRLPMDDATHNVNPALDAADLFNEWYKAAAWDRIAGVNRVYGFGRDVLTTTGAGAGGDANYQCSGDPFENAVDCTLGGTTPVGYYGGPNADPLYSVTVNANSFAIHDLCGNVHQWMQCRYSPHAQGVNFRAIRGGSFNDLGASAVLKAAGRTFTSAVATNRLVGFRVVRALPPVSADLDGSGIVNALDYLLLFTQWTGPLGVPATAALAFDLDQDGDVDLADYAILQAGFTGG